MPDVKNSEYLADLGNSLIENGYKIIPIKPGAKYPELPGWEKLNTTRRVLKEWLTNGTDYQVKVDGELVDRRINAKGMAKRGIGVLTRDTPAVDIDVSDAKLAKRLEDYTTMLCGDAPLRIGKAPKRLLMFRTDEPFTKIASKVYVNDENISQQVEILGDGQQFVAFHTHPDTGKPYRWPDSNGPDVTPMADLPELTPEKARRICAKFEAEAEKLGWKAKKTGTVLAKRDSSAEVDEYATIGMNDKIDLSFEQLRETLMLIPNDDVDYDMWYMLMSAVVHQTDGSEEGREMFSEWSSQSSKHDEDTLDRKWASFIKDNDEAAAQGRQLMTARYILKVAKEYKSAAAEEKFKDFKEELEEAADVSTIEKIAERIKHVELNSLLRDGIVNALRIAVKRVTGESVSLPTAKRMIRYERPLPEGIPEWLESWCFLSGEDKFYNVRSKQIMTHGAFNSTHSRFLMSKQDKAEGKSLPSKFPAHYATNVCCIPVVEGKRYMPGAGEFFNMGGVPYANLYTEKAVPVCPEKYSKKDLSNIERVKGHMALLFPDQHERNVLMDWMAYIVQNPGKKVNWAILMQGTESDGKSFFSNLLGSVIGEDNFTVVSASALEDKYTKYAEGSMLAFVEEVKMHGHNRYDVLNNLKQFVSNSVITIRRMNVDEYNVPNFTSYLLATNYKDALPIGENATRYYVMFSHFQTRDAIEAFNAENPTYFDELFRTLQDSTPALRKWLMEHEVSPSFKPKNRAPDSAGRDYMAMMGKSDEMLAVEELIKSRKYRNISKALLSSTFLAEALADEDVDVPQTKAMRKMLSDAGFVYLGRFKIDGTPERLWSLTPERFSDIKGKYNSEKIRKYLDFDL